MFSKWFKSKVSVNEQPSQDSHAQASSRELEAPAHESPSLDQGDLFGVAEAPPVKSPCNGVCDMDWQNNICIGCFRTPHEIGSWRSMSEAERRASVAAAEKRARELSA